MGRASRWAIASALLAIAGAAVATPVVARIADNCARFVGIWTWTDGGSATTLTISADRIYIQRFGLIVIHGTWRGDGNSYLYTADGADAVGRLTLIHMGNTPVE